MIGSIPRAASAATAERPIAPVPITIGISPGSIARAAHVELADRERVDHRDGVVGHVAGHGACHRLGHDEELAEASLRLGVLPDHLRAADATVDEQDRHRGHARPDRELIGAAGPVADDLADELVAEHDVAVRVVDHAGRTAGGDRVVMIHEVHVRRADRGRERAQQQLALSGHGIGGLAHLEPPVSQHHCSHAFLLLGAPGVDVEHGAVGHQLEQHHRVSPPRSFQPSSVGTNSSS